MKDFFKMLLAVICGLFIASILCFLLTFGLMGSLMASSSSTPAMPKSGVLKIDLSKVVFGEQTQEANPLNNLNTSSLLSGNVSTLETVGIWDAVQAINAAAEDPAVKFIYIRTDGNGTDITTLEELRAALENFRTKSSKPVVTYMEDPAVGTYYFASVSDKIYMTPHLGANPRMTGVATQMLFFGDLLKQFDVNVQLIRHGKYKSAGETFTRNSASPENREQYQRMMDSMWETMGPVIAESRGISLEDLDTALNELQLNLPQDFIDHKLVDELLTREELKDKIATLAVEDKYDNVKWMDFPDYVKARVQPSKARQKIAVIYTEGDIVTGSDKTGVAGERFASIIAKVRADSTVKAVVLRVNSPGGSVLAAEQIKTELDLLQAEKPLIASYGTYAASGGYWISNHCEKIFTDATTLTGSIGVFGMIPDLSKTAKDFAHVGVESVTTHKHGTMSSLIHTLDSEEHAYMLRSIETIYDRFTKIVSEGRGIPQETVDAVGQGRVWTGADALKINLVDSIGTLEDAIRYAAVTAGDGDLTQWRVKGYPAPPTMMEQMMDMMGGKKGDDNALVSAFRQITRPQILARLDNEIFIR